MYESVVACELKAHGHKLYYYDNRNKGEVDYLVDDYDSLSVVPIEVKSGKDYTVHSALNNFISNETYSIKRAVVFSNERRITHSWYWSYVGVLGRIASSGGGDDSGIGIRPALWLDLNA